METDLTFHRIIWIVMALIIIVEGLIHSLSYMIYKQKYIKFDCLVMEKYFLQMFIYLFIIIVS